MEDYPFVDFIVSVIVSLCIWGVFFLIVQLSL